MARVVRLLESSQRLEERTPGIARALRALAAAKRRNRAAVARGEAPRIAGKRVSLRAYVRKYGKPKTKTKEAMPASPDLLEEENVDLLDAADVEFAVGLLNDEEDDPDDLRSFVIERAYQLGVPDLIPREWTEKLPSDDEEPEAVAEEPEEDPEESPEVSEPPIPTLGELGEIRVPVVEEFAAEDDPLAEGVTPSVYIHSRAPAGYRPDASDAEVADELRAIRRRARRRGYAAHDDAVYQTYANTLSSLVAGQMTAYAKDHSIQPSPDWVGRVTEALRPAIDTMLDRSAHLVESGMPEAPGQTRLIEHPGNHDQRVHSPTGRAAIAAEKAGGGGGETRDMHGKTATDRDREYAAYMKKIGSRGKAAPVRAGAPAKAAKASLLARLKAKMASKGINKKAVQQLLNDLAYSGAKDRIRKQTLGQSGVRDREMAALNARYGRR